MRSVKGGDKRMEGEERKRRKEKKERVINNP